VKSPSNQCEFRVTDRSFPTSSGLLRQGGSEDFEIAVTSQRDQRVLRAASWMLAAALWRDAGPRLELSHATLEIVDPENDMIDANGRAFL